MPAVPVLLAKLFEIQLDVSSNKIAPLMRGAPSLSEITPCSGQIRSRTGIVRREDSPEIGTNKGKIPLNIPQILGTFSPFPLLSRANEISEDLVQSGKKTLLSTHTASLQFTNSNNLSCDLEA